MTLGGSESVKILELLERIHVTPEKLRQQILLSLKDIFGYQRSTFFLIDEQNNMVDPVILNLDDHYCNVYCKHYYKMDIFKPKNVIKQAIKNIIVSANDVMPAQKFKMTEYYNDFLRKQDIHHEIAIFLQNKAKLIGVIGLYRSLKEKSFSTNEIERLKNISTHLSRVLADNLLLEDIRCQKNVLETYAQQSPTGLIVFDQKLKIHFLNERAQEICTELVRGRITESPEKFLNQLVRENFSWQAGFRKLIISPSLKRYIVHVLPAVHFNFQFKELYMVCLSPEHLSLSQQTPKDKALSNNLLTEREREVLALVLEGKTNKEIAEALFISIHTVKTHLQNIFKKMNVTNRTSLYRVLSSQRPVNGTDDS